MRRLVGVGCVVSFAVGAAVACGDDTPSSGAEPPPDAAAAEDAPPAVDSGPGPVDPVTIAWELLPELPTDGVRVGGACEIAFDPQGRVLVTYGEYASGYSAPHSLAIHRYEAGAWTTLGDALETPDAGGPFFPRMAVASDGTVYAVYALSGSTVVKRFRDGAWTELPPPAVSNVKAIAVDSAGQPALVGDSSPGVGELVRFDGVAWSPPTTPFPSGPLVGPGVITVTGRPDGSLVVIARQDAAMQPFVLSGTTWSPLGAALGPGELPAIASSPTGGLAVAWSEGDNVYAARFDPASQSFVEVGGALGQMRSRYAVVAVDSSNRPFVAWRELMGGIRVSVFANDAWQALPAPPSERGTLPAIAVDESGLPAVCWEAVRADGGGAAIHVARARQR